MQPATRYALHPAPDAGDERRSLLLRDGARVGEVPGAVLEAQYETPGGDVLFVTHDIPFEESLEIVLLDPRGGVLERVSLRAAYATGAFEAGPSGDPAALTFRFFGGPAWELRVLLRPVWRLPFSDPPGTYRQSVLRKRLDLRVQC